MSTDQLLFQIQIELDEEVAHIRCPYCFKSSSVALSYSERPNKPWWNTSNFNSHVQRIHKDLSDFDSGKDCEYILFGLPLVI